MDEKFIQDKVTEIKTLIDTFAANTMNEVTRIPALEIEIQQLKEAIQTVDALKAENTRLQSIVEVQEVLLDKFREMLK